LFANGAEEARTSPGPWGSCHRRHRPARTASRATPLCAGWTRSRRARWCTSCCRAGERDVPARGAGARAGPQPSGWPLALAETWGASTRPHSRRWCTQRRGRPRRRRSNRRAAPSACRTVATCSTTPVPPRRAASGSLSARWRPCSGRRGGSSTGAAMGLGAAVRMWHATRLSTEARPFQRQEMFRPTHQVT
jgi:hypothetical protein